MQHRNSVNLSKMDKKKEIETCFLCEKEGMIQCEDCNILYCSKEHSVFHKHGSLCLPFKVGFVKGKGRVVFATRDIKAFDLVLVDPGTVIGPNYRSDSVCIECLRLLELGIQVTCPKCRFPMCSTACIAGPRHQQECPILAVNTDRITSSEYDEGRYAHVAVLRLLLLEQEGQDPWLRTNQLMDHLEMRHIHPKEWIWYTENIINYIQKDLKLGNTFTVEQIEHVIGLLNVNAVCLQFSKHRGTPRREFGKGIYPIFAIMSHECVCNTRYSVDPASYSMYVRARKNIKCGEELTVQYLSALWGNHKRRRKIKEEWYFDCTCVRCSDKTECATYISAVKCFECSVGNLLPIQSLHYDSNWSCSRCLHEETCKTIHSLVGSIEQEFDSILDNEEYWRYREILDKYSGSVLHPAHWIMTTARRNLMQYLCYYPEQAKEKLYPPVSLNEHYKLCEEFWNVLKRIDPGWSEISLFAQRELHFAKLNLLQSNFAAGCVSNEEFGVKSRNSIEALDKLKKYGEYLEFNQVRDNPTQEDIKD